MSLLLRLAATAHLLGLRLHDRLDATGRRDENGSITIETVAWAVGIIAIVSIAVVGIRFYVTSQLARL